MKSDTASMLKSTHCKAQRERRERDYKDTHVHIFFCLQVIESLERCLFFIFRCKFHLYENNDVSWKVPDGSEIMPFFNSDTYEVCLESLLHF